MKNICTLFFYSLLLIRLTLAQASGELRGQLKDEAGKPVAFAAVVVYSGESQIAATTSDDEGYFIIKPISAGTYNVVMQHMNYKKLTIEKVTVSTNQAKYLDETLAARLHEMDEIVITGRGEPLIDKGKIATVVTIGPTVIAESPLREVKDFVATTPGVVQRDEGGSLNIRGSREGGTQYIVDGIKIIGDFSIPKAAIQEISILTGGIPAQFGDATGGIVVITTKSFFGR